MLLLNRKYFAINKCKPKPSGDGNISYRCVYYQTKGIKSHSSCTIKRLPNGEEIMIRAPKVHIGHGKYTDVTKCFKKAVAEIEVKCKEPDQNPGLVLCRCSTKFTTHEFFCKY